MASPAIFKGRLTKFLTNGGILIPARPQSTDASAVPTPGEIAYDTENENFVVYQNGNWEVVAVFSDLVASNIVNTPYGTIEAVDVQSALNELSDEKVARSGDSMSGNLTFADNKGIESTADVSTLNIGTTSFAHNVNIGTGSHTSSVNIGTGTGITTINIGGAGDTVNIGGELVYVEVSDLQVQDKEIIVNVGGAAGSSESAGLHVEEDGVIVGLNHVANNRQSWEFKAPANEGSILVTPTAADTDTNIVASSTVNRTITLPDASDTLATNTQITDVNQRIDDLTTDDIPESLTPTNLYFTDERAKTAAVVNSVAGDENDQAPSVTSIVTYVNDEINALDTDDIEEGATNQYFTAERAQDAAWDAIDAGTNVAGNPITATYDDLNNKIELLVEDAAIANAKLENSSVTLNGTEIALGESDFVGIYTENVLTSGTLSPNTRVMADTSGGAITLTLPAGSEDAYIEIKDAVGSWDSNNLTVAPASGEKINGLAIDETLICDVREGWLSFAWDVTNSRWNLSTTAAINLNDIEASATTPGIVSITDQEFAGVKTFTDGILLAPNTTPLTNPSAGLQVYAKADNKLYTLNSDGIEQAVGSGGSIILVDQVAHGFVAADVGRPVYLNGSTYEFAQADTEAKAEVAGLISRVISADQFEICLGGEVSSVGADLIDGGGALVEGEVYFLSASTAGKLTTSQPSVVGQISKPVGIARTTSALDFFNMRGSSVGGTNVYTQISLANSATTTIQNASAYDSVELAGWVYINATTDLRFHFKAQVTKKGDGTDYLVSFQTSGDTPPSGFDIDATSAGLVQVVMPSVAGFTSAIAQFSLNGPAVGASLPLQIESTNVSFSTVQAKDSNGIELKDSTGTNRIVMTATGITTSAPVTLSQGIANAYSITLSGTYTANTFYAVASSTNLSAGTYIAYIYMNTFLAAGAGYQWTWISIPFVMGGFATNSTDSITLPSMTGDGHARNGMNSPSVRVRQTPSADGKTYVDVSFAVTLSALDGSNGKNAVVYFKRIA